MKHPPVIVKKLGRHNAWGTYQNGVIEIDPRAQNQTELRVLIHEYFHHLYPEWTEEKVDKDSRILADFLWRMGYRKPL